MANNRWRCARTDAHAKTSSPGCVTLPAFRLHAGSAAWHAIHNDTPCKHDHATMLLMLSK
eukprot:365574-Chlamydomonas_euryale.AAC.18